MEALWYEKRDNGSVRCLLCPNDCVIADGKSGVCRVRTNRGGVLCADSYSKAVSLSVDPVEKKPLFHFFPSRRILSTGPNGCNFSCGYCQNSEISQRKVPTSHIAPELLAELASREGSIGVAYTYTEPFVWYEYIRVAGALVRDRGLVNVLVTNGYVSEQPLRELLPLIDAMNIDVKSMRPDFYRTVCGGRLEDVLRTVTIASAFCHVEVTNLVITGYNDADDDFRRLTDWIASVNPSIPLHFSRYFPRYRFNAPQTPVDRLVKAYEIARETLPYVYVGNIQLEGASDTYCPSCGATLVARSYYTVSVEGVRGGKCASCGADAAIIGV